MAERSLIEIPLGRQVTLARPKLAPGLRLRLAELGIRRGARVTALQRTPGDGRVLQVGHSRIVLDHETCELLPVIEAADD